MNLRSMTTILGAVALMGAAGSASAIPIATVGSVDTLLSSAALPNSGEASETSWASTVLGFAVTFDSKIEGSGAWTAVDGNPGLYAVDFGSEEPGYYLVKTGAKSTVGPGHTHFLFQNLAGLQYGVVNLLGLGFKSLQIDKISHATIFEGPPSEVPEPATLALFGAGLLAAGWTRRRSLAKKA
jgi:hypothetical protein